MDTNVWTGLDTTAVVITGLVVVFAALIALVLILMIMGYIMDKQNKSKKESAPQPTQAPAPVAPAAPVVQPEVAASNDDEIIVAISAAISAYMMAQGETKPFAIKSIKRVKEARPAWSNAGIIENTRPF